MNLIFNFWIQKTVLKPVTPPPDTRRKFQIQALGPNLSGSRIKQENTLLIYLATYIHCIKPVKGSLCFCKSADQEWHTDTQIGNGSFLWKKIKKKHSLRKKIAWFVWKGAWLKFYLLKLVKKDTDWI